MMRWAVKQRMEFITEKMSVVGCINRKDLMDEFQIGPAQATNDLGMWQKLNRPLVYNMTRKRYEEKNQ